MRKVELYGGITVDKALEEIKAVAAERGEEHYCEFNGKTLYSTDTIDEAYMKVTGMNKADYDAKIQALMEKREAEEKAHMAKIPELVEYYKKEARGLVLDERLEDWDNCLEVRLGDIYRGMELQQVIDCSRVMKDETLDREARLRKAYKIFNDADHSGMSARLTCSLLRHFCPDGNELADACNEFRYEENHKTSIYVSRDPDGKLLLHFAYPNWGDDGTFRTPNQVELNPLLFPELMPGERVEYKAGELFSRIR